jgi:hypothetical protein
MSAIEPRNDYHACCDHYSRQAEPFDEIAPQARSAVDAGKYHEGHAAKVGKDEADHRQASLRRADNREAMKVGHVSDAFDRSNISFTLELQNR